MLPPLGTCGGWVKTADSVIPEERAFSDAREDERPKEVPAHFIFRPYYAILIFMNFREGHVCPWWLIYTFDNPLRRFLHDPSAILAGLAREGMTVADIGCGGGYFSLTLAGMVGPAGTVIAVDVQQEMLDMTMRRAKRAGVAQRIRPVLAAPDDIGVDSPVDFALAFWMAHEVEDTARFFSQVSSILKAQGNMLVVEPKMHVGKRTFRDIVQAARDAGFRDREARAVRLSRAVILERN